MKKTLLLFVLIIFQHIDSIAQHTIINGNIKNLTSKSLTIGSKKIVVNEKGNFQYEIEITESSYLEIVNKDFKLNIFLEPQEHVEITFDKNAIEKTIRFSGKSKQINHFLFSLNEVNQYVSSYINNNWVKLFSKSEDDFVQKINDIKQQYLIPYKTFLKENKIVNKQFRFTFENNIRFTFDKYYLNYTQLHNKFTGNKTRFSKKNAKYINKYDLDKAEYINVDGYKTFGMRWIAHKKRASMNTGTYAPDNRDLDASLQFINSQFKNTKVKSYWAYQILHNHIENHGVKNISSFIEAFNATCEIDDYRTQLNSFYKKELKKQEGHQVFVYKRFKDFSLEAHVFNPGNLKPNEKRPAMVYFHGGSWSEGKPDWHFGKSDHGFINVCVEYRTYDRHGTLPFEEVSDAKTLFRWLRQNANKLQINPDKIIASGNSAGGHLILAAAMLEILDEPDEDLKISSKPNALVLKAAAYDLSKWKWFREYVADKQKLLSISPTHNIRSSLPPMVVYHGTEDGAVPFERAKHFVDLMKEAENDIEFYPIKGVGHNLWFSGKYWRTSQQMNAAFFRKHGFVK